MNRSTAQRCRNFAAALLYTLAATSGLVTGGAGWTVDLTVEALQRGTLKGIPLAMITPPLYDQGA